MSARRYANRDKVLSVPGGVKADTVAALLTVLVDHHEAYGGSWNRPVVHGNADGSVSVYAGGLRS